MFKASGTASAALVGSFLCILFSPIVVAFYTFNVFFEALSFELGWGRGILSLAITVGTLTVAVVGPIAGRISDRGNARRLLITANIALVAVVAAMPILCTSLTGLYLGMGLIGVLASCFIVTIPRIISSWFDRRRGLALGVVMSGAGLGSAVVAPVAAAIIDFASWQQAYLILAAIVLLVPLPAAILLVHEAPRATLSAEEDTGHGKPRVNLRIIQLSCAFLLVGIGLHGVLIHFSPMLTDRGIGPVTAAGYFAVASVSMFIGRIACGLLLDRFSANFIGAALMAGAATGVAVSVHTSNGVLLVISAILFGLGVSAELDLISYIVSRSVRLEHFSRSFAAVYSAFMIGTSIGPPLLGWLYDEYNDYTAGATVAAVVTAASAAMILALPRTSGRVARPVGDHSSSGLQRADQL